MKHIKDDLTKALISKEFYSIDDLLLIMKILRSENGCPWDKEQTHSSIRKNFIEETYEVCEAIDNNDTALLKEELGDVLLQIVFHSQMEAEKNTFEFKDVIFELCQKLIIRHPHVFGDVAVSNSDEVLDNWQNIKQKTKGQETAISTLLSVPRQLPALMRSQKIQSRAKKANSGFGYSSPQKALADLKSEVCELEKAMLSNNSDFISDELGDVLFSTANAASSFGLDAEELLTHSTDKFVKRFECVEKLSQDDNVSFKDVDINRLDELWHMAKEQD